MKTFIYNEDNLTDNDIDSEVTRVKCFIINSHNQILLGLVNGGCHLPGGHVEEDEPLNETVKREVYEETGIILNDNEIQAPFYEIKHYTKNYRDSGKNKLSRIVYFYIKSDKTPNYDNIHLTDHEIEAGFNIKYIDFNNFRSFIENRVKDSQNLYKIIAEETINAFEKLNEYLK